MNSLMLRIVACLLMLADHIGVVFFADNIYLRLVGRVAFPLFAFLIAEGCKHSRNPGAYFKRLLFLAAVSQVPFSLAIQGKQLNVLFGFSMAVLAVVTYPRWGVKVLLGCLVAAELFRVEYGSAGVLMVFAFWRFRDLKWSSYFGFVVGGLLLAVHEGVSSAVTDGRWRVVFPVELFSVFAVIFADLYNSKPGKGLKWLFYSFYPLHLMILWFTKLIQ